MWRSRRKRLLSGGFPCVLMLALTVANGPVAGDGEEGDGAKTIAMIGAGDMGQALGNLWAAAGYHMIFATRNPDELGDVIEAAGHGAEAASVGEAVERADIITLAVPYKAEPSIAEKYGLAMKGKVLINVDNALEYRDGDIAEKAEAVGEAIYSARLFEGTRFIRAFNLKAASSFPDPDEVESADFEIPWTTNVASVRPIAEKLIRATGGTPVYEGDLDNAREY